MSDDIKVLVGTPVAMSPHPSVPGSVKRPCRVCEMMTWASPASLATAGEDSESLCVPCYLRDPPDDAPQPISDAQLRELRVAFGFSEDPAEAAGDREDRAEAGQEQDALDVHHTDSIGENAGDV